jgi:RNA polymerase sigma-70 factor (family 1)
MQVLSQLEENECIHRLATGDPQAFRCLYLKYYDRLYAVALMYVKRTDMAEDTVQQVFCKIWEKKSQLPAFDKFENYLFILTRNEIIGIMRRGATRLNYLNSRASGQPAYVESPEDILIGKEKKQILNQAVLRLTPQQRTAYQLSRIQQMSYEEIANEMGLSISTVKWHISAALHSIRTFLKQHERELLGTSLLFFNCMLTGLK